MEAEFQTSVFELCAELDLRVFHAYNHPRNAAGYPDLTIAGPRGVIWAELKMPRRRLYPAQWEWRDMLLKSGQRVVVWKPWDLDNGTIRMALEAIA